MELLSAHDSQSLLPQHYQLMDEYDLYENGFALHTKYQFINVLQQGSFGKVSHLVDVTTGYHVAIKLMAKNSSQLTNMYRHEVYIMKKLGLHDNHVQLLEFFDTRSYHILVLDYCEGGDLYDKILLEISGHSGQEWPLSQKYKLISQVIDLVQYMHSRNIYHRDLKPENLLLLDNDRHVKICDYGLATVLQYPLDIDIGTEKYIAPELISQSNYDALKLDLWSLGITICFMLFGKCPFRKLVSNDGNFVDFKKHGSQWLISYYSNKLTPAMWDLLKYLLAINPQERDLSMFASKFHEYVSQTETTNTTVHNNSNGIIFELDGFNSKPASMSHTDIKVDVQELDFDLEGIDEEDEPLISGMSIPGSMSVPMAVPSLTANSFQQPPSLMHEPFSWADDNDDNIDWFISNSLAKYNMHYIPEEHHKI